MNMKIGFVMTTEFSGHSRKADQMPELIHELYRSNKLGYSFGLKYVEDENTYSEEELKYLKRTSLCRPLFALTKRLAKIIKKMIPKFTYYYANEVIFGIVVILFYHPKEYPDVVVLKPRPSFLVKYFKKRGCIVVVEASENHTRFTEKQLKNELERLQIELDSEEAYLNDWNIVDFEKGINSSDALICLTHSSVETYVERGYEREHIKRVPLYIRLNGQESAFHGEKIEFVCVANHSPLKGTYQLVKTWCDYKIENKLIIIGGINTNLKKMMDSLEIPANVEFLGMMNIERIREYYRNHTCVSVLLSLSESFGRSIYEGMCEAVPVIVTPFCTLDLVEDKYNGIIIDPRNESEIFRAVSFFENITKDEYIRYSENVKSTIMEAQKISFASNYVTAIEELYEVVKKNER